MLFLRYLTEFYNLLSLKLTQQTSVIHNKKDNRLRMTLVIL